MIHRDLPGHVYRTIFSEDFMQIFPESAHQYLGWEENIPILVMIQGDCITIRREVPYCLHCGVHNDLNYTGLGFICDGCLEFAKTNVDLESRNKKRKK